MVTVAQLRDIEEEIALKHLMPTSRNPLGHVIYIDDYERSTIYPWVQDEGTVTMDNTVRLRGTYGIKYTSGAIQWQHGGAKLSLGIFPNNKFGVELWWMTNAAEGNWIFKIGPIAWRDGTNRYEIGVYYDAAAAEHKWYYESGIGAWTAIPDGAQILESGDYRTHVWHYAKLTWGIGNYRYGKLISDDKELDLSALSLPSAADGTFPRLEIASYIQTRVASAQDLWIDDFNFTEDEPE